MNKKIKFVIISIGLLISHAALSWNYLGHEVVSEIAYRDLSAENQKKLDLLLDDLINNLPSDAKKVYKAQTYGLSKLAKLSILPDFWKRLKFDSLTNNLNITDYNFLQGIGSRSTADWHYKSPDIANKQENLNKYSSQYNEDDAIYSEGRLDNIIPKLLNNLKDTSQPRAKALGIIFIAHLLGDAHQPLHAVSRSGDRGGNAFCLSYKKNTDSCKNNLHQFWDSAGKYLNNSSKEDLLNIVSSLEPLQPKNQLNFKANNLTSTTWLNESYNYWSIVYNTKENKMPSVAYTNKARAICKERLALAGFRLSQVINKVLNS